MASTADRPGRIITQENETTATSPGLWLPLIALAMLILLANGVVANHIYQQKRADYWAVVESVAEVRSQQVSNWLEERLRSAALHSSSFPQAELYTRWRMDGDERARDLLFLRLGQFAESGRFEEVFLIDSGGSLLSDGRPAPAHVPPTLLTDAMRTISEADSSYVGPYIDQDGQAHLDFLTTLPVGEPLGRPVVVLHTDANDYFPEEMRKFPLPTASGEIVLFRIEHGKAVALSELRHDEGSAFEQLLLDDSPYRLATELAAAGATAHSRIEGMGYRGVAVFGTSHQIRGTDWYLWAKMDVREVVEAALRSMLPIGLFSLLLFGAVAFSLAYRRQRRRLLQARVVQRDQGERLQALQLLKAVADSADDAIFVKDLEGRYLSFNRAACEMAGKSEDEVLGQDDNALFPPAQAAALGEIHRQVLTENRAIMNREVLDTIIGPRTILARKGPLHDQSGRLIGVYGISRDVTELERSSALLSQHDQRLEERNRELERFNEAMVGRELAMLGLKKQVNELSIQLGLEPPFAQTLGSLEDDE